MIATTSVEFSLRDMAHKALAACKEAGLRSATISVIVADPDDPDDCDLWNVTLDSGGGLTTSVSTAFGDGSDG